MTRLLRIEASAVAMVLALWLWHLAPEWWLVVICLVLPDLSMLGYMGGPLLGARVYNLAHSIIGPALLAVLATALGAELWQMVAGLWALHIAIDRALGYGLKLPDGFGHTHLGRIGK